MITYDDSHVDFQAILTGDAMRRLMEGVAAGAQQYAESISPVLSGEYQSSWDSFVEVASEPGGTPRQTATVVNRAPYADVVEQNHHVVARTAAWVNNQ